MCKTAAPLGTGSYGTVTMDQCGTTVTKRTFVFVEDHNKKRVSSKHRSIIGSNMSEAVMSALLCHQGLGGAGSGAVLRPECVDIQGTDGHPQFEIKMPRATRSMHECVREYTAEVRHTMVDGVLRALVSALHSLHMAGIVHCDIKPANIMFAPSGDINNTLGGDAQPQSPHLIDLGSARLYRRGLVHRRLVLCTYPFCAPEALEAMLVWNNSDADDTSLPATSGPDPLCDAYSLGATLVYFIHQVYLCTGSGNGSSLAGALKFCRNLASKGVGSPPLPGRPAGVSPDLYDRVLPGLLALDPAKRLSIAQLHVEMFGMQPATIPQSPPSVPDVEQSAGPLQVGHDAEERGEDVDMIYAMCEEDSELRTSFALAVDVRDRARANIGRRLTMWEVDACLVVAQGALYPDSDGLDDLNKKLALAVCHVLGRLECNILADTCDWIISRDYGVREEDIDTQKLCAAMKLSRNTREAAATLYMQVVGAGAGEGLRRECLEKRKLESPVQQPWTPNVSSARPAASALEKRPRA